MPVHERTIKFEFLTRDELSDEERSDLEIATAKRVQAVADETNYKVGTTIRTRNCRTFTGKNRETRVHQGTHAEIAALDQIDPESKEAGIKRITVIGGIDDSEIQSICITCGACAQHLIEYCRQEDLREDAVEPVMVVCAGLKVDQQILRVRLRDLLPFAFNPQELRKN